MDHSNQMAADLSAVGELVLYYGLSDSNQEELLTCLLAQLGLQGRKIEEHELNRTVDQLIRTSHQPGGSGFDGLAPTESIAVMHGLTDERIRELLAAIRRTEGVSIELKAVVTDNNANWPFINLAVELRSEHAAMQTFLSMRALVRECVDWLTENASVLEQDASCRTCLTDLNRKLEHAQLLLASAQEQGEMDPEQMNRSAHSLRQLMDEAASRLSATTAETTITGLD